MASALSAAKICKGLSIVSALYLGSGLVNIFARMPVPRIVALVYAACSVAGLFAVAAAFMWSPGTFRALALWSVGPAAPVFGTESWQVAFLGLLNLPVSFYLGSARGRVFAGVNLVPAVLFVLLAVYSTKLVKAAGPVSQRELPPGESS